MSQPPGEPQPSSEPADDKAAGPAGPGTGSEHGETSPADAPGDRTTVDRPSSEAGSESAEDSGEQPWWTRGQTPHPPAGRQAGQQAGQQAGPAPYQPQPWGYPPQAPPRPPAGPAWGAPRATAAAAGRDRLSVHLVYEGVLALIAVVLIIFTAVMTPHQNLTSAFGQAGYLGLMTTGFAFSLRTGSPNLAVGAVTYFASTVAAWLITAHDWGRPAAFLMVVLLSTLIGLALGFVVAVLSVPSWAATLGAVALIQASVFSITRNPYIPIHVTGGYSTAMWYGLFFVLSVGGAAVWLIPAVRGTLSAAREPGDPARWLGLRTGLGAIAGLTGSSFLGGLAAIPLVLRLHAAETGATSQLTFVLAAALFGGVSVFGRRAGIFGTLLAVTILAIVQTLVIYNHGAFWVQSLVLGLAALFGVAVSRGIESVTDMLAGRTRPAAPYTPPAMPPGMAPGPYGPPPGVR